MEKKTNELTYRFKYIYLLLIIADLIIIIFLFAFPASIESGNISFFGLNFEKNSFETITVNILQAIFLSILAALILSFFYDYNFKKEEKKEIENIVNNVFHVNLEPLVVNAVLSENDIHRKIFNAEMIDRILKNCLSIKLNDVNNANISKEIKDSLINNLITKINSDIIENLYVSLTLTKPNNNERIDTDDDAYKVEYKIEYQAELKSNNFKFMVTNDRTIQKNNLGLFSFCLFLHFFNLKVKNILY
jgi:hypothetical protein